MRVWNSLMPAHWSLVALLALLTGNALATPGRWTGTIEMSAPQERVLAPLDGITLTGSAPPAAAIELRDGRGTAYARVPVEGGYQETLTVGCALGPQTAVLLSMHDDELAEVGFTVRAETRIETDAPAWDELWDRLTDYLRTRRRTRKVGGREVPYYVSWVRDNVHTMKAFKYWDPDVGSYEELFLAGQNPGNGMIGDYLYRRGRRAHEERREAFEDRYTWRSPSTGASYQRLPVEADLEYLLVEGVHTAWRARGDNLWLAEQLPRLERALSYAMTDPLRWSDEYRLVQRAYTIDTWDFKFYGTRRRDFQTGEEVAEHVFNIHPETPRCIMHGDNSGMFQACRQMAEMYAAVRNDARSSHWAGLAEQFRRNTNRACWNGRYYDHWVPVTPLEKDTGGVDGTKMLSLSNPYDINRGLPDHEQAVAIIDEYRRIRRETRDEYMAEWFSIYPWFPEGFNGTEPGQYVNGGILTIVAGELAKAAFRHGREAYGADILERVHSLLREPAGGEGDGRRRSPLPCTFTPTGEVSHGIPDEWGQAAVVSAIMEGLAGIRDRATEFEDASIAPRWAATGAGRATATARYGASDGYASYRYRHQPARRQIRLQVTGSGRVMRFHVLLPPDSVVAGVQYRNRSVEFTPAQVEDSHYADFAFYGPICGTVTVHYEPVDSGS
jgi:hypothetical protein